MPRKPRVLSSTGIYHIILRSVNQHIIFEEASDYQKFLSILSDCKKKYDIDIYAYCLMDNHIHLLLQLTDDTLSSFFQSLGTRFVRWYNNKYSRSGHLFQDRFKSEPVNDMAYFSTLLRYIHQNPLMAGIVQQVSDYPWSSWQEYTGETPAALSLCATNAVLKRISLDDLRGLVDTPLSDDVTILDIDENPRITIGDQEVHQYLLDHFQISMPLEVQTFDKEQRNQILLSLLDLGAGLRQLSRLTGVTYGVIYKLSKRR